MAALYNIGTAAHFRPAFVIMVNAVVIGVSLDNNSTVAGTEFRRGSWTGFLFFVILGAIVCGISHLLFACRLRIGRCLVQLKV